MGKLIIIHGNEQQLINKKLNALLSEYPNSEQVIIDYQDLSSPISSLLEMPSMFNEHKLLIIKDAKFLSAGQEALLENEIKKIDELLKISNLSDLILIINEESIDKRRKIIKIATQIIEANIQNINPKQWVIKYCQHHDKYISDELASLIIYRVGKDLSMLTNELNKLILYQNNNSITRQDVDDIILKITEESIWDLIDATLNNDKISMLKITNDLIYQKEDPVKIYITIASQYRFLLNIVLYKNQGIPTHELANKMGVHPYRVEKALDKATMFDERMLFTLLDSLYELDVNVKTGILDKELAFKEWLINL